MRLGSDDAFGLFVKEINLRTRHRSLAAVFLLLLAVGSYHSFKPMPDGLGFEGRTLSLAARDVHVFSDLTFVDDDGVRRSEQQIFDEVYRMIDAARSFVYIDMFFFSDFNGAETRAYRALAGELTDRLIQKMTTDPDITIQVVTDPINVMYGGLVSPYFQALEDAGVNVVITDLRPLRDSNPIYSSFWRTLIQWFGNSDREGYLPNPVDADSPKLWLRSYLELLNFKANHRKVVVADIVTEAGLGISTLVTSANPNDGSGAHSNIAVRVDAELWRDVLASEAAVVAMSGGQPILPPMVSLAPASVAVGAALDVQFLTEQAIERALVAGIGGLGAGDRIDVLMFAIADRDVVDALADADRRGVVVRMLLDPNKGAFGQKGNGMPNLQVAQELMDRSVGNTQIRWCNTRGEQCHSKLVILRQGENTSFFLGSANLTKRNLGNYNLEADVLISGGSNIRPLAEVAHFFERQWSNEAGRTYSNPLDEQQQANFWMSLRYRVQEFTGLTRW